MRRSLKGLCSPPFRNDKRPILRHFGNPSGIPAAAVECASFKLPHKKDFLNHQSVIKALEKRGLSHQKQNPKEKKSSITSQSMPHFYHAVTEAKLEANCLEYTLQ